MSGVHDVCLSMTTWRNICMIVDNGRAAPSAYSVPETELNKLVARYGANCGILTVIPADATQPSEEARAAINGCLERNAHNLKGVVWVVEGRGFASAVVRATLTTMGLVRRKMQTWKVVDNVEEGLGWLSTRVTMHGDVELQDALRAMAEIRAPKPGMPPVTTPVKKTRRWAWTTNDAA